ncbi:unnamed protein product [Linum tenue]|uniref:Cytochrome P450 n=1 Tax=Linum tenue TaxID=586396 RepID=A0AAV0L695_9ROSI|nr:unnamed protein product [Linum tenue]
MNVVFESLTLNVTTRIVSGKKSHVFHDNSINEEEEVEETKQIGRLIKEFMKLAGFFVISDIIPLLDWTREFAWSVKAMRRVDANFHSILSNWISQHEAVPAATADSRCHQDVIHVLLSSVNCDYYDPVMEELDREFGRERWVREGDIPNLVYLQVVVKETLRLYPSGPLRVPREANEDSCIAGYHVPKGTWVFLNVLRLHRNPGTWNSPLEFMP